MGEKHASPQQGKLLSDVPIRHFDVSTRGRWGLPHFNRFLLFRKFGIFMICDGHDLGHLIDGGPLKMPTLCKFEVSRHCRAGEKNGQKLKHRSVLSFEGRHLKYSIGTQGRIGAEGLHSS